MVTINDFIAQFAEAIEVEKPEIITSEMQFRELDEWSSIAYLSVIALMDEVFNTQLEETEFNKLRTVQDLYDACTKK